MVKAQSQAATMNNSYLLYLKRMNYVLLVAVIKSFPELKKHLTKDNILVWHIKETVLQHVLPSMTCTIFQHYLDLHLLLCPITFFS